VQASLNSRTCAWVTAGSQNHATAGNLAAQGEASASRQRSDVIDIFCFRGLQAVSAKSAGKEAKIK
jgi:hypothetical protein